MQGSINKYLCFRCESAGRCDHGVQISNQIAAFKKQHMAKEFKGNDECIDQMPHPMM